MAFAGLPNEMKRQQTVNFVSLSLRDMVLSWFLAERKHLFIHVPAGYTCTSVTYKSTNIQAREVLVNRLVDLSLPRNSVNG